MLRSEDLARDGFEDILKSAKSEIPKIYPGWTDHNPSDPGITILELLSYLAEMQQYHLNYIHRGHYLRYLKLLGAVPRGTTPSKTYLRLTGSGELPKKTLFYADDLPFETACGCTSDDNEIISLESGTEVLQNEGGILSERLGGSGKATFYPFGRELPNADKSCPEFRIKTKRPIKAGSTLGIYFAIGQTGRFTAISSASDLLVSLSARVGGAEAEILLDETMGFTESGVILLKTGGASSDELVFSVSSGEFTAVPIVTSVILNVVPAYQKKTSAYVEVFDDVRDGVIPFSGTPYILMSAEGARRTVIDNYRAENGQIILPGTDYARIEAVRLLPGFADSIVIGSAIGLCSFRIKPDIPDILPDELGIYIDEGDSIYKWEVVSDFDRADKLTRCCVYDRATNELVFGDGRKGMPPRGVILLLGCAVSAGGEGNVKEGMVNSTDAASGISAENILPSTGGSSPQSIDDCFEEVRSRVNAPDCCVTLRDFENAVRSTPGVPDKRVKAFVSESKENCVCIAAECRIGADSESTLMRNIKRNILPRVMVGTKVEFPAVRYAGVNIFISVSASLYYSNCREQTEKALRYYFNSDRVNFGDTISVNEISRYVCGLSWINAVRSVDLSVSASDGERLIGGDIRLKNVCLPIADKVTVTIYN